ncbi:unnamed protein product [Urochloa humidicola]
MARTKITPRKSTCRFLPPRVRETHLVTDFQDAYQAWRRHYDEALRQQAAAGLQVEPVDEDDEEPDEPEEEEELQNSDTKREQELQRQQQRHDQQRQGQQQPGAGGGPGGDPDDDGGDDDDDGDDLAPVAQPADPEELRWVVHDYVRDGGDCYFHRRLMELLRRHYGSGSVGVEYHCEWWTHSRFRSFWRAKVKVRVPDHWARAARRMTEHYAISARDTMEAVISDAARQAYYRYRQKLWGTIQNRPERYHPRRRRGATACTITSTAGIANCQFASIVALVSILNTELDAASDEIFMLRNLNAELQARNMELESLGGQPAPGSPVYIAKSPTRKTVRYGTVEASTTVEDP